MASKYDTVSGKWIGADAGDSGWAASFQDSLTFALDYAQVAVIDQVTTTPPTLIGGGDAYLIAAGATGAWSGKDGQIAVDQMDNGTPFWFYLQPRDGWTLVDLTDPTAIYVRQHDGSWSAVSGSAGSSGNSVLFGSGAPGGGLGTDGDSYINTATFDFYTKASGSWTLVGSLQGAAGSGSTITVNDGTTSVASTATIHFSGAVVTNPGGGTANVTIPVCAQIAGDIGGSATSPTITGIQAKAIDAPTTKGDLFVYNGTAIKRIGAGANGQVLSADSGAADGLAWITISNVGAGSLAALSDVTVTSVADLQLLQYDAGAGRWVNVTDVVLDGSVAALGFDAADLADPVSGYAHILRFTTLTTGAVEAVAEGGMGTPPFPAGVFKVPDGTVSINCVGTTTHTILSGGFSGEDWRRMRWLNTGKLEIGDGTAAFDTNLYRQSSGYLKTDGIFEAAGGILIRQIANTGVSGTNGEIANTPDGTAYLRVGGVWVAIGGPAAGGGSLVTTNLYAQWQAESGVTTSGGQVTAWADQSGNGHTLSVAASAEITLVTSQINGYAAVAFTSAQTAPLTAGSIALGKFTAFVVMQTNSTNAIVLEHGASVGSADGFDVYTGSGYASVVRRSPGGTPTTSNCDIRGGVVDWIDDQLWRVVTLQFDGASVGHRMWIDGILQGNSVSGVTPGTATVTATLNVGARSGGSLQYEGQIAMILLYDDALNPTNRAAVEGYLRRKYGI